MWSLWGAAALAVTAVDPASVPVLGAAVPTAGAGWEAPVLDARPGRVRVWVARDEAEAGATYTRRATEAGLGSTPLPLGADQAVGDPFVHVLLREGEVVIEVERPEGAALELAERLLRAAEDAGPWPAAPALRFADGRLRVVGAWHAVAFEPAAAIDRATLRLRPVPVVLDADGALLVPDTVARVRVRVWDRFGRSAVAVWDRV